jgi:hypothetical protein
MRETSSEARWAAGELRTARLGDARRHERVRLMMMRAAQRPGGKLSHVITDEAELQGAYDLLEGGRVTAEGLCASFADATLERVGDAPWLFAIVDGSSIQVTDLTGEKGLGSIGALVHGARGMKVITALGVDDRGVPVGLLGQVWWARTTARKHSREKRKVNAARPLEEKETRHWITAIEQARARAQAHGKRLWFQIDREGDNRDLLLAVSECGHDFTVRSAWDRVTEASGEDEQRLRARLAESATMGSYEVDVAGTPSRKPRLARMLVRAARVTLAMRRCGEGKKSDVSRVELNAVWAREDGTTPAGEKPLDWLLLTNHRVDTFHDAKAVIDGYTQRWRIEDFHRVWKSSGCRVEETQLRSADAVTVWATILASVAGRIERLRLLARKAPNDPASVDLAEHEIRALVLLKRQRRKQNEKMPEGIPSIYLATLWIAELGGYTGKSSGGPPGALTIRRGLEVLGPAAQMLLAVEAEHR